MACLSIIGRLDRGSSSLPHRAERVSNARLKFKRSFKTNGGWGQGVSMNFSALRYFGHRGPRGPRVEL
jgi:hypothetical protein